MKIGITGANGFVGSYLVKCFSKDNEVIAFNRQLEKQEGNVKYINWDLHDKCPIKLYFDIFIHSASDTGYEKTKKEMIENNVNINKNVLELINNSRCKHFIYISSSSVYQGLSGKIKSNVQIDEKNLKNSYSLTKFLAEKYIIENLNKNIKFTILRPRAIYGKGDRVLLPNILKNQIFGYLLLPGNGKAITSLTEINDFVNFIGRIVNKQKAGICNFSTKTDSYENLYRQLLKEHNLKGIIKIPIFVFKILSIFNENKYSYIVDTFGRDKILI